MSLFWVKSKSIHPLISRNICNHCSKSSTVYTIDNARHKFIECFIFVIFAITRAVNNYNIQTEPCFFELNRTKLIVNRITEAKPNWNLKIYSAHPYFLPNVAPLILWQFSQMSLQKGGTTAQKLSKYRILLINLPPPAQGLITQLLRNSQHLCMSIGSLCF